MSAWLAGSRGERGEKDGAGTRTRRLGFRVSRRLAVPREGRLRSPVGRAGHYVQVAVVRFARHPGSVPSDFVSRAKAHDSGLRTADAATRRRFASDLRNLTLAGPDVNRNRKKHHDAAHWMPQMNRCRFAARVAEVRRKYARTVDAREVNAPERVLSACASTEMVVRSCEGGRSAAAPKAPLSVPSSGTTDALRLWDDNGNGRITCREARRHGIAPAPRGYPVYPFMHDGDGVVCE